MTPSPAPTPIQPYPAGATGYAISWPQCGMAYPDEPFDFGIVGVNDGWAGSENPCFADEFRWAQRGRYPPAIYMNTNLIDLANTEVHVSKCGDNDDCRAYQYGWSMAEQAYDYAASSDAIAPTWWLDVQIVSEWSDDPAFNADSIFGSVAFLQSRGIRVGISSTAFQWQTVAGDAEHGLPVWDASAYDADQAIAFCQEGKDFGGGQTEQIAYVANGFEVVLACGGSDGP